MGGEVGKAGGYLVYHRKELKHHHENDWKPLKDVNPQRDTLGARPDFGGCTGWRPEEEQCLTLCEPWQCRHEVGAMNKNSRLVYVAHRDAQWGGAPCSVLTASEESPSGSQNRGRDGPSLRYSVSRMQRGKGLGTWASVWGGTDSSVRGWIRTCDGWLCCSRCCPPFLLRSPGRAAPTLTLSR